MHCHIARNIRVDLGIFFKLCPHAAKQSFNIDRSVLNRLILDFNNIRYEHTARIYKPCMLCSVKSLDKDLDCVIGQL